MKLDFGRSKKMANTKRGDLELQLFFLISFLSLSLSLSRSLSLGAFFQSTFGSE